MKNVDISIMSNEELIDLIAGVCLDGVKVKLPSSKVIMQKLDVSITQCAREQIHGTVDIDDYDECTKVEYLTGYISPQRKEEIENGANLTPEEHRHCTHVATRENIGDFFTAIDYSEVSDSHGRKLHFAAPCNSNCGSYSPNSDHKGPLSRLPYDKDMETQLDDGTIVNFTLC